MKKKSQNKTVIYSMMQGLYFAAVNSVMGFAVVYLLHCEISENVIGILLSLSALISAIVTMLVGNLVDKSRKLSEAPLVIMMTLLTAFLAVILFSYRGNAALTVALYGIIIVANYCMLPLINSLGMRFVNNGYSVNYGVARGVGSISYAVFSVIVGILSGQDVFGPDVIPVVILAVNLPLLLVVWIAGGKNISAEATSTKKDKPSVGFIDFIRNNPWLIFLVAALVLIYIPHCAINNFIITIVEPMGGTSTDTGYILAIAAAAEIPMMFLFSLLLKKRSSGKILGFAGLFFTVKALATLGSFLSGNIYLLYATQLLQGLGYALLVPASVYFANECVAEEYSSRSQSFIGIAMIIASVVGNLIGGYLSASASVTVMLTVFIIISAAGSIVLPAAVRACLPTRASASSQPHASSR